MNASTILLLSILGAGCSTEFNSDKPLNNQNSISPIILIGDFFEPEIWEDANIKDFLESHGLIYGGLVTSEDHFYNRLPSKSIPDVFEFSVANPSARLAVWETQLRETIIRVQKQTGAARVILAGYGTGGLIARSYVVHRPDDHRVARLIMVATPHAGLDLASLAVLTKDWTSGKGLQHKAGQKIRELVGHVVDIDLDAPLMRDLQQLEDNESLDLLNRSLHPADLNYSNIMLQYADAVKSPTGLINGSFSIIKMLPPLRSQAIENFRHSVLQQNRLAPQQHVVLHDVDNYYPLHRAILKAVEGPVQFLRAEIVQNKKTTAQHVVIDFTHTFPGLLQTVVETAAGTVMPGVSKPAIYARRNNRFGRLTVPIDAGTQWPLKVIIRSIDEDYEYVKHVVRKGIDHPFQFTADKKEDPEPVKIRVLRVENLPTRTSTGENWDLLDLMGGPLPDARISIAVDGREIASSKVILEAGKSTKWDEEFNLNVDPRHQTIQIRVWDKDPFGDEHIGSYIWQPGTMNKGHIAVHSNNGIKFILEISWEAHFVQIVASEPFRI